MYDISFFFNKIPRYEVNKNRLLLLLMLQTILFIFFKFFFLSSVHAIIVLCFTSDSIPSIFIISLFRSSLASGWTSQNFFRQKRFTNCSAPLCSFVCLIVLCSVDSMCLGEHFSMYNVHDANKSIRGHVWFDPVWLCSIVHVSIFISI